MRRLQSSEISLEQSLDCSSNEVCEGGIDSSDERQNEVDYGIMVLGAEGGVVSPGFEEEMGGRLAGRGVDEVAPGFVEGKEVEGKAEVVATAEEEGAAADGGEILFCLGWFLFVYVSLTLLFCLFVCLRVCIYIYIVLLFVFLCAGCVCACVSFRLLFIRLFACLSVWYFGCFWCVLV